MNKLFWLITMVIAFLMGYVAHQEPYYAEEETKEKAAQNCPPVSKESAQSSSSEISVSSAQASSIAINASIAAKSTAPSSAPDIHSAGELLSTEEIEKILPKPYSNILKNNTGEFGVLYKTYASSSSVDDWDKAAQQKLMQMIQSGAHAKDLQLEAAICKNHICELRLLEKKSGIWSKMLSELVQRDTWDFGKIHSFGRSADSSANNSTPYAMAYLILLSRK